jgi:hypothetical protein
MKRGYAALLGERLKFLPRSLAGGISATLHQATRYFGIFSTAFWAVAPHFHLLFIFFLFEFIPRCPDERDFRYAPTPVCGIFASLRQAAGNSNSKLRIGLGPAVDFPKKRDPKILKTV